MAKRNTTAALVKFERQRQKITQLKLAQKAGLSQEWVCRIEGGHRKPGLATLKKLAHALKVDLAYLAGF